MIAEPFVIENISMENKPLLFKIKCSNIEIFKVEPITGILNFEEKQSIRATLKKSLFLKQMPSKVKFLIEYL